MLYYIIHNYIIMIIQTPHLPELCRTVDVPVVIVMEMDNVIVLVGSVENDVMIDVASVQ